MTRYCAISIAAAQDWDSEFLLDDYCKKRAGISYPKQLNPRPINDKQAKQSNFIVYSDASASGCGAHLDLNGERVCHKLWEVSECEKRLRDYVTGYEAFKGKWALRHGRNTNSLLGSEAFDGDVLAIRMNFS